MGQGHPSLPPPYPRTLRTLVLGLLREDAVEALLARLRLLRGRSCSIESSERRERGCVSPLTGAEDRVGVRAWRPENAAGERNCCLGTGGLGRSRPGITYQEQCQERWAALAAVGRGQLSAVRP